MLLFNSNSHPLTRNVNCFPAFPRQQEHNSAYTSPAVHSDPRSTFQSRQPAATRRFWSRTRLEKGGTTGKRKPATTARTVKRPDTTATTQSVPHVQRPTVTRVQTRKLASVGRLDECLVRSLDGCGAATTTYSSASHSSSRPAVGGAVLMNTTHSSE